MKYAAIVFVGGGIGAVTRYLLSSYIQKAFSPGFPFGTLTVNILGCLIIGLLMTIFEDRFIVQPALRLLLTVGFLGGLTTYSTFSFETVALLQEGNYFSGFMNILGTTFTCLCSTWIGILIGKLI
ncbi:MAG: fluoride efflux transporter CrcB [Bacteroidota bacterium]|nr:fluoride efflux transporter CrcB [Bacteroidota bacterium]MDP4196666.1 fluoride efflux transporter CrcB [Bacteroidota bacterium]